MIKALDICVCTYQRPQIVDTLKSLQALNLPDGYRVSVLVVDNDELPSARNVVEETAEKAALPMRYVHCPQGNISIARNGALAHSDARFLAFIDDDEMASRDWLMHLVSQMEKDNTDVVLGPVEASYPTGAPAWMQRTRIHATMPVWVDDKIITGYTCNVLIDRHSEAIRGRTFDVTLGQTGGEDTAFFAKVVDDGGVISFAPDALVTETITADRVSFGWLLRRRYRMGQTHGQLVAKDGPTTRLWAITLCKVAYCAGAAIIQAPFTDRRNMAVLRGTLHVGALNGLAGGRTLRLYGNSFPRKQRE